jgi:hypothetical protein
MFHGTVVRLFFFLACGLSKARSCHFLLDAVQSADLATLFLDFIFLVITHDPILPEAIQSGLEHGWRMGHTTARSLKTVSAARTPPLQGKGLRSRRGY